MEILLLYLTKGQKIPAAFTKMLKDLYHLWQPVKLSQSVWCFFGFLIKETLCRNESRDLSSH